MAGRPSPNSCSRDLEDAQKGLQAYRHTIDHVRIVLFINPVHMCQNVLGLLLLPHVLHLSVLGTFWERFAYGLWKNL